MSKRHSLVLAGTLVLGVAHAQLTPATPPTTRLADMTFDSANRAEASTTYIGASFRHTFTGRLFDLSRAGFYGTLGTTGLHGPIGGRVIVGYIPSNNTLDANIDLTLGLGGGSGFEPYFGLGAGTLFSGSFDNPSVRALDFYANGLVGLDYRFSNDVALYTEFNPRFYFSNIGAGAGLPRGQSGGFVFGHKTGLKIYF